MLILTLLLLQTLEPASYRRLLFGIAPELLSEFALSVSGTLVYRFHHLQQLLTWLAQQGIALEQPTGATL